MPKRKYYQQTKQVQKRKTIMSLPKTILVYIISLVCNTFHELHNFHMVCQNWIYLIQEKLLTRMAVMNMRPTYYPITKFQKNKIKNGKFTIMEGNIFWDRWITHAMIEFVNLEKITISSPETNASFTFPFQPLNNTNQHWCGLTEEIDQDYICCCYHKKHWDIMPVQLFPTFHQWKNLKSLEIKDCCLSIENTIAISSINGLESLIINNISNKITCGHIVNFGKLPNLNKFTFDHCGWVCYAPEEDVNTDRHVIPSKLWINLTELCITDCVFDVEFLQLMQSQSITIGEFEIDYHILEDTYSKVIDSILLNMPNLNYIHLKLDTITQSMYTRNIRVLIRFLEKYGFKSFMQERTVTTCVTGFRKSSLNYDDEVMHCLKCLQ